MSSNLRMRILLKKFVNSYMRRLSSKKTVKNEEMEKIRNIGILAHIDAGKTTSTERMLFYSGLISQMGEVHHGNTVTDYMAQERERGITITSAAVTFYWRNHQFNLIDTPGHIDFTMEVEQSLNVLDGAVCILDASAGVEAQTLTVWRQADRYKIPRIIFLNKMDRNDASVKVCLDSIEQKLDVMPLCLQIPVKEAGKLVGLVDVLTMEKLSFSNSKLEKISLTESQHPKLWNEAQLMRSKLVDKISEYNEDLADKIIVEDSVDNITTNDIVTALKEETQKQVVVPVVMGSAYKNIGVQSLMDSVILYLPSPEIRSERYQCFDENVCAKAFKIVHDRQRGTLVFVRVYNGTLYRGQRITSLTRNKNEQINRLYTAFADDLHEVNTITNGNIAVVAGLKSTKLGDLLSTSASAAQKAKEKLLKSKLFKSEASNNSDADLFGLQVKIPEPVFFCSIEPQSTAYQTALDTALMDLQREDPSLSVTQNYETGQTVLGGMGELHLEIIKDRILRDYKVEADLGQLQINYHEALIDTVSDTLEFCSKIGSTEHKFNITLSVIRAHKEVTDTLLLDKTPDAAKNIGGLFQRHLLAVKNAIDVALSHGPRLSCKVSNAQIMLHHLWVGKGTSETVITAGTTQFIQKLIRERGTHILEPIMDVEIVSPPEYVSVILADLSRRRAPIESITLRATTKVIKTKVPLAEFLGYATILRTISSGTATFSMEFNEYKRVPAIEEEKAIRSVRGF